MLGYARILLSVLMINIPLADSVFAQYSETDQGHQSGIPLVINEFMASNNTVIRDPQGQYDDWIEIYNYGADAIDTGGMYLTDNLSDTTKWRIPAHNAASTTIQAGGYLLIWADSDTADDGLHANFRLDADGEEIGLFDRDGVTRIDSIVFPKQTTDVSYGRFPDANDNLRFFATATPAAQNEDAYLGEIADTKFSHNSGFHDAPFSVTIATETEDAAIYYTLDGSEPYRLSNRGGHSGTLYSDPISISRTTCLRALAVKPGWKPSGIETRDYIFLEPDARDFSSNLPIIVIDTYGELAWGMKIYSYQFYENVFAASKLALGEIGTPNYSPHHAPAEGDDVG